MAEKKKRPAVLVQISRGVAPVSAIVQAVEAAHRYGWTYIPITGLPLIEAKNTASRCALERYEDLIMIEDDVLADKKVWDALAELPADVVGYARARMRDGNDNVYTDEDGKFLYTGNCFCRVPIEVLQRLPRLLFESRKWSPTQDALDVRDLGLQTNAIGSDTGFWYHIRHLDPSPPIVEIGRVAHLKHELNLRRDNQTPCEIKEW